MITNDQRIAALETLPCPAGFGWKVRASYTNRGWRLLTTREEPNYPTVKEAIDAFIQGNEIFYKGEGD